MNRVGVRTHHTKVHRGVFNLHLHCVEHNRCLRRCTKVFTVRPSSVCSQQLAELLGNRRKGNTPGRFHAMAGRIEVFSTRNRYFERGAGSVCVVVSEEEPPTQRSQRGRLPRQDCPHATHAPISPCGLFFRCVARCICPMANKSTKTTSDAAAGVCVCGRPPKLRQAQRCNNH